MFVPEVMVERCGFAVDVEDGEILFSVAIEIGSIDSHAGPHSAIDRVSGARFETDLFEFAAIAVDPQEVLHGVIGDEQVRVSITVDIGRDYAQALPARESMPVSSLTSAK